MGSEKNKIKSCLLTPQSNIYIVHNIYEVVVSIDVSSSMNYIDPKTGDLLLDRAVDILEQLIKFFSEKLILKELLNVDVYLKLIQDTS
jgi:hypothetical protein